MASFTDEQREQAEKKLQRCGQSHLLAHFERLDDAGKARLLHQIDALNVAWLNHALSQAPPASNEVVEPYRDVIRSGDARDTEAVTVGRQALEQGRVGVLLVAGGQGTRLGFDGPKGEFSIGPLSGRSLFQMHVEQIAAVGQRYGVIPPLFVMTSPANHERTCAYFAEHNNFGLPSERVLIFMQGVAPAVDPQGKLLLARPDSLVLTPNGNGGLFAALRESGAFQRMAALGVDTISYIQVDNPLSYSCDPRFIGYHVLQDSAYSCKAIQKTSAHERVGNFACVGGKLAIVEYSEIPEALAERRDESGELLFGYGNPGLFIWSRAFAEAQAARIDLPVHRAFKKIPCIDAAGEPVMPDSPNGYKLETFALDTLPCAERSLVLACERAAEFAPVKNAEGADSPQTAKALIIDLHRGWLVAAGATVADGVQCEISPFVALEPADLTASDFSNKQITNDLYLR